MADGVAQVNETVLPGDVLQHPLDEDSPILAGGASAAPAITGLSGLGAALALYRDRAEMRIAAARSAAACIDVHYDTDVLALARLISSRGQERDVRALARQMRAGQTFRTLCLDLIQPTARYFGELWLADLCSFVDVTLAAGALQTLLREESPARHPGTRVQPVGHALLVPLPGEQHGLGIRMVAEFFRVSGWAVWSTPFAAIADLLDAVRATPYSIAGISVGSDGRLDEAAACIRLIRSHALDRRIRVLVGGPAFLGRPARAAAVGADGTADSAEAALRDADSMARR